MFKEKTMIFSVVMMMAVLVLSGCDNPVQNDTKKDGSKTEHEIVEIDIPSYLSGRWKAITPQYGSKDYTITFNITIKKAVVNYINTLIVRGTDTPIESVRDIKVYRKGSTLFLSESFQAGDRIQVFNSIIVQEGPNRFAKTDLITRTVPPDSLKTSSPTPVIFQRLP